MTTKIYIIGNIFKNNQILLRKKFVGSLPYTETWYSFGVEFVADQNPIETFITYMSDTFEINTNLKEALPWSNEVKIDHDGLEKSFIYLQATFEHLTGDPKLPDGHEKIEFIDIDKLADLDIVPPTLQVLDSLNLV
jgi:8-oxo-dGTP pyrophosphatase MutT (NUDIX family)